MAAAYRSSSTANTATTPASSLVVSMPTGVQPNDNLFAAIAVDGGSGATISTPTGWTLLQSGSESTDLLLVIFWRLADGTEAGSYTWTFDSARNASGSIDAYSGGSLKIPRAGPLTYGTAGTSFASDNIQGSYTGMPIEFNASFNTTAAGSWTAPSGFTRHTDQSTTKPSSNYIGLSTSNYSNQTWMLTGAPSGLNFTNSQTVKAQFAVAFLEDYHSAVNQTVASPLVIDNFSFGALSTTAATGHNSASVQQVTHYPNELILLAITFGKTAATVSSVTGGGLTWTFAGRQNTSAGNVEFWYAFAPNPGTYQPNITFSGSVTGDWYMSGSIQNVDMTGTNGSGAIGAIAGSSTTLAAPSTNITTTRNGSMIFAVANNATNTTVHTTPGGQTVIRAQADSTNNVVGGWWFESNPVATAGTVVTMNLTAPTNATMNMLAIEILPAISHGLASTGAGT